LPKFLLKLSADCGQHRHRRNQSTSTDGLLTTHVGKQFHKSTILSVKEYFRKTNFIIFVQLKIITSSCNDRALHYSHHTIYLVFYIEVQRIKEANRRSNTTQHNTTHNTKMTKRNHSFLRFFNYIKLQTFTTQELLRSKIYRNSQRPTINGRLRSSRTAQMKFLRHDPLNQSADSYASATTLYSTKLVPKILHFPTVSSSARS